MELEIHRCAPLVATDKPPILFIHGAYHAAWCWKEHFLPYFAKRGHQAVAFSLRGHGASARREQLAQWRLSDYLDDVLRVADSLERPPVICGHSLGGVLALLYLEQRTTPATVLLAPGAVGFMRRDALRWLLRRPWASVASLVTRDMRRLLPTFRPYFFSPQTPAAVVDRYMAQMQDESYHVLTDQMRLRAPEPRTPVGPMLLVHGTYDSIPLKQHRAMAARYGAQLAVFPLGHELMLEPEWTTVADRVASWLESLSR